jgi:nifR3 family TIM-barrel protein
MDGITDMPFRQIADAHGRPDILYTEFVPVEAIAHGAVRVMPALLRHDTGTPTVAQFFGRDLKSYYKASFIALELGYDGIDINMGCPDRNIAKKGGGAGLIGEPDLAISIIRTVKQAVADWAGGKTMIEAHIPASILVWLETHPVFPKPRRIVPVTVKTRTGLDKPITEEWMDKLISARPDGITLHGRTLQQMYRGSADWNEIAKAAAMAKRNGIRFFGNGDVKSRNQAVQNAQQYGCDGILIGRAALGNPWLFSDRLPTMEERFGVMRQHARLYLSVRPELGLYPMRKHLAWYCAGFEGSKALRTALTSVVSLDDLDKVIQSSKT